MLSGGNDQAKIMCGALLLLEKLFILRDRYVLYYNNLSGRLKHILNVVLVVVLGL